MMLTAFLPMSAHLHSHRSKAYFFLFLNSLLWGASSPIIKNAFVTIDPATFLLFRFLIAAILFLPIYFLFLRPPPHHGKTNFLLLISLALLGAPLTLTPLYWGLELTTSFHAAVLVALSPLFTIAGGVIFLKEKITKRERIGLLISLLGTSVFIVSSSANYNFTPSILAGNALIILSNIIWAAFLLLSKGFKAEPAKLSLTSYLISVPFFFLLTFIEPGIHDFQSLLQPSVHLAILYMAIFGSVVGFLLYIAGQKHIEASEAATFTYLNPLFAFPLSYFWLKEPVTVTLILSLLIVAAGVIISEKR